MEQNKTKNNYSQLRTEAVCLKPRLGMGNRSVATSRADFASRRCLFTVPPRKADDTYKRVSRSQTTVWENLDDCDEAAVRRGDTDLTFDNGRRCYGSAACMIYMHDLSAASLSIVGTKE